jgi:replicative DNA helicase
MNLNSLIEKAFLCSLFVDSTLLPTVTEILEAESFLEPRNELIYRTIASLYEQGHDASVTSVAANLNKEGLLENAGGISYLREIVIPTEMHAMGADPIGMAEIIKEEAKRRDLRLAGEQITNKSVERNGTSADDVLAIAEQAILEISNKDAASTTSASLTDLLPDALEELRTAKERAENATAGIPTGLPELDEMTNGFKAGQMIIIAARPAIGKSTLAVDFARSAAFLAGKTVLFFSLEMAKMELVNRIISAEARVETSKMKKGELDENDWMNIEEAKSRLQNGTFIIDDQPKTGLSRIRSVATRQKYKPEGLDMIVIDYLGLMETPSTGRSSDSRQTDISSLSRGIKLLAKELEVPIIILSQLNRKSEERTDGKPMLSDLRESGSLEQDADMVFLIHRPEAVDENNRPGETDLIVAKHRGGPKGTVPLTSMLSYCKFVPGQGVYEREPEFLPVEGEKAVFATTEDEVPW